jgi:co-chaperonin GroES (HSP10)
MSLQLSKLNTEFTPSTTPDPENLPSIRPRDVLIRPVPVRETTKGGLILPDNLRSDMTLLTQIGKVLAVGSEAFTSNEFALNDVNVGDYVIFDKFAHDKLAYKNVLLILCEDMNVKMKVTSPEDVDPSGLTRSF